MSSRQRIISSGGSGRRGFGAAGIGTPIELSFLWKLSSAPFLNYGKIAMSRDGHFQVVGGINQNLKYSHDYGVTWTTVTGGMIPGVHWKNICCSYDGQYFYACEVATGIWKSSDYGVTFTNIFDVAGIVWNHISCDGSGRYLIACINNATPATNYVSTDYGVSFNASLVGYIVARDCSGAVSLNGARMYIKKDAVIYTSTDFGVTWPISYTSLATGSSNDCCCSSNGKYVLVSTTALYTLMSTDYGVSFQTTGYQLYNTPGLAMSSDGKYMAQCNPSMGSGSTLFISADYGVTYQGMVPDECNSGISFSDDLKYITRPCWYNGGAGRGYVWIKKQ